MILDRISRISQYESLIPGAGRIAAAFAARDPACAPCEVREKRYATRPDEARRFEVHSRTIDLMIAIDGAEVVNLCPMERLTPAEALSNGADGRKMDGGPQGSAVLLEAGWFLAIFPGEAHMVGGRVEGAEGRIEKWVVKAGCPAELCAEVDA